MKDLIYEEIRNVLKIEDITLDEDMKKHTTFRAGGKAKYFIQPQNEEELIKIIQYLRKNNISLYVIGNGSNLLVKDEGFSGAVIKVGQYFSDCTIVKDTVQCGAGVFLSKVASEACRQSLSGLEFAAGIPGLIGGAVTMNAGAYGGEMKNVIKKVHVVDTEGNQFTIDQENMDFGYRRSIVQSKNYIVTGVEMQLQYGNKEEITQKMEGFMRARQEKQPLEYPSAGSTFKRPEGYYAGKLIMDAGLAGYQIGGAAVSEKHCGFVINKDQATATDIINLIQTVINVVKEKYDVTLEPEVKII